MIQEEVLKTLLGVSRLDQERLGLGALSAQPELLGA